MKTSLLITVLGGLLAASIGLSLYVWWQLGDVAISGHGLAAIALGAVASLGLGGGLMFLVFYSSRRGHDEAPQRFRDDH